MDSPVRVLHTAGFRFDSPSWEGPPAWAAVRVADLWQTFEEMLALCEREQVDLLFIAGDLFEQDYARKETVDRVAGLLGRLASTSVFIAPGDRDPLVTTSAYRLAVWPDHVHIFSGTISRVEISAKSTVVYGAGWTAYRQEQPFLDGFQVNRDGRLHLMLLHAELESRQGSGFIPLLPAQIEASGLHYLALGHREAWTGIRKAGETFWADCGSPEARSFREGGPHGVVLAEIGPGSARFKFRELGRRRYIEKTITLPPGNPDSVVSGLLAATSVEERQKDVFRVNLTGTFSAAREDTKEVVDRLRKLLAETFRFLEIVPLVSEDSGKRRIQTGFPAAADLYAARIQAKIADSRNAEERTYWELALKIGLAALGQGRIDNEN